MSIRGKLRLFKLNAFSPDVLSDVIRYLSHDLAKNLREIEGEVASAATGESASNVVKSESSGIYTTSVTTYAQVPNFSLDITTTGGAVLVKLVDDEVVDNVYSVLSGGANINIRLHRDGVAISETRFTGTLPPSAISFMDEPEAGDHTYQIFVASSFGGSVATVSRIKMVVAEI
jgi:hypothetical protein